MYLRFGVALEPFCTYRVWDLSGRGTTRADDAQGTPAQSHISSSILAYEGKIGVCTGSSLNGRVVKSNLLGGAMEVTLDSSTSNWVLQLEPLTE